MKIAPTIEGGLRIDPETKEDWYILRSIIRDANGLEKDTASRLGDLITDERISEDWKEIIVPDLRESFSEDLNQVYAAIESAAAFPSEDENPVWIKQDEAMTWYSALNQARLTLEEQYKFGPEPEADPANLTPARHEALLRSHFYCALQSFIIQHSLST
ncbi:MAG: hypothetical protein AB8D78_15740 [Akkermansiaceae bacterium]